MSENPRRSIAMPAELWVALDDIATHDGGRSVASVIRLAVAAYVDEHGIVNGLSGQTRRQLRQMAAAWPTVGTPPTSDVLVQGKDEQ